MSLTYWVTIIYKILGLCNYCVWYFIVRYLLETLNTLNSLLLSLANWLGVSAILVLSKQSQWIHSLLLKKQNWIPCLTPQTISSHNIYFLNIIHSCIFSQGLGSGACPGNNGCEAGILPWWDAGSLQGTMCLHTLTHIFIPKGDFVLPFHVLACYFGRWDETREPRENWHGSWNGKPRPGNL